MILDGLVTFGTLRTGAVGDSQFSIPSADAAAPFPVFKAGDLGILFDLVQGNSASVPVTVIPSGFTFIDGLTGTSADGFGMRLSICYKIYTGSELGTNVTGQTGLNKNRKTLMSFRMSRPIQNVAAQAFIDTGLVTGDPGNIIFGSATAVGNALVFGAVMGDSVITSFTSTGIVGTAYEDLVDPDDATGTSSNTWAVYSYYPYGVTPATMSLNMGDEGNFSVAWGSYFLLT